MIPEPEAWISGRYHNMTVKELFNTIYTQYYAKSFRFANLYVRNDLAAEDITTDRLSVSCIYSYRSIFSIFSGVIYFFHAFVLKGSV